MHLTRLARALAPAALATAVVIAVPVSALAAPSTKALAVPRITVALPSSIEDVPPYVAQTSCDATAKPGAVALMNLLLKTYPGSSNMGIAQTCAAEGMTSEHSEGRALDWGVNRNVPRQKAQAQSFLTWLFATDADGNDEAMARRLGVMYVIWNDRIRMTGGDWRPYDASVCGKKRHSATTCHENHIHISLTWAGAWKRTSFWTGKVAADDYGPCKTALQLKTDKPAHRYTTINLVPCSGTRSGHGGSGGGGTGSGGGSGGVGGSNDGSGHGTPPCPDGTVQVDLQGSTLTCAIGPSGGADGSDGSDSGGGADDGDPGSWG